MIPASVIARLATLGLTAEQTEQVAALLSEVEAATEGKAAQAIEARRANDRERKSRQRSRDITGSHVTARDGADNPPPSFSPPTPPSITTPSPASSLRSEAVGPDSEKPPSAKRGTRLPADWRPNDEGRKLAVDELGGNKAAHAELATFTDYWIAQPGQKGVRLDWDATWRNWVRRAAKDAKARAGPSVRPQQTKPGILSRLAFGETTLEQELANRLNHGAAAAADAGNGRNNFVLSEPFGDDGGAVIDARPIFDAKRS